MLGVSQMPTGLTCGADPTPDERDLDRGPLGERGAGVGKMGKKKERDGHDAPADSHHALVTYPLGRH